MYFGEGSLDQALSKELPNVGKNVMLTYGGKSIKENGIYDLVKNILLENDKNVIDFEGIMSNPTYKRFKKALELPKKRMLILFWQ